MSNTALSNHRFDLAVQGIGEQDAEAHFELGGILDYLSVDEDLVGFAEVEGEGVLSH